MTYCGDHTLFSIRKAASSRKHTCGSRGRRGAARTSTAIATAATARAADDIVFSSRVEESPSPGRPKYSNMNQTDPQSAPRDWLKAKKCAQPAGAAIATGRLTASQANAPAAAVLPNSRIRPARRQSSSMAPKTISG